MKDDGNGIFFGVCVNDEFISCCRYIWTFKMCQGCQSGNRRTIYSNKPFRIITYSIIIDGLTNDIPFMVQNIQINSQIPHLLFGDNTQRFQVNASRIFERSLQNPIDLNA